MGLSPIQSMHKRRHRVSAFLHFDCIPLPPVVNFPPSYF